MRTTVLLGVLAASTLLAQPAGSISDLAWMAGHWAGAMGRAQVEEHWIAPAGGAMLGLSRTVARERMAAFEFLRIETRPEGLFYVAQPGGRPPTDFKLTRTGANLAVFENPRHDFPKIITYRLEDASTLVATVEGDEGGKPRKLEFRLKKAEAGR